MQLDAEIVGSIPIPPTKLWGDSLMVGREKRGLFDYRAFQNSVWQTMGSLTCKIVGSTPTVSVRRFSRIGTGKSLENSQMRKRLLDFLPLHIYGGETQTKVF